MDAAKLADPVKQREKEQLKQDLAQGSFRESMQAQISRATQKAMSGEEAGWRGQGGGSHTEFASSSQTAGPLASAATEPSAIDVEAGALMEGVGGPEDEGEEGDDEATGGPTDDDDDAFAQ